MEPTPLTPQDLPEENKNNASQSGAAHIDMGKILLPKKEVPGQTPASAQRINAGVLLEQEMAAGTEGTKAQTPPPAQAAAPKPAASPASAPAPQPETTVQSIETYQRDIEHVIKDDNISVLSIATAEAERRGTQHTDEKPAGTPRNIGGMLKTAGIYLLGFLLLAGASGALAYIIERPTSVGPPPAPPASPFISVDDTKEITITPATSRGDLMASLTAAKQATALSLGLMSRLLVTVGSTTASGGQTLEAINAQSFFNLIAPDMPVGLLQTIRPDYLLGVHVYNDNQPFLIMSVDSYEQGYAGMLAWEPSLQQDLAPLFNYTPTVHIPEENIATTTSTSSDQFIQTGFVDRVVENHDARVIQNDSGDISLLWTFIDRNTLVITTNDATLREIISRLKEAPVTPIPGP